MEIIIASSSEDELIMQPHTESSERIDSEWQYTTQKKSAKFVKNEENAKSQILLNEKNLAIFHYLLEQVNILKQNVQIATDSIINFTIQQITILQKENKNLYSLSTDSNISSLINQQLLESKNHLNKQFQEFQSLIKIEPFFLILNQISYNNPQKNLANLFVESERIQEETINTVQDNFQYQLISESKNQLEQTCQAFIFNNEQTLLFVAYWKVIIVQEFDQGILKKELQWLTCHQQNVQCLCFTKNNQLASGGQDKQIIIWKQYTNKQWVVAQILQEHLQSVNCLILNDFGESFISGSFDKTVKFWVNSKRGWQCQTSAKIDFQVFGLCLNEQENILLVYGMDQTILILERESEQLWSFKQAIQTQEVSIRVGFLNATQFIVCSQKSSFLDVYKLCDSNQFVKVNEVQINEDSEQFIGFPVQFIKQKNVIVVKKGRCVNLYKISKYGQITLQQTIKYHTENLNGVISKDGNYLVTWDYHQRIIQVLKFQQF